MNNVLVRPLDIIIG